MKKTFLVLFLMSALFVKSQNHGFVTPFVGLGIPLGDYLYNGYALVGSNFGIEGGYYFKNKIGLGIRIASTTNQFDNYIFAYEFEDALNSSGISYNSLSVDGGKWSLLNAGIGLYSTISISQKFKLETKGVFGLLNVKSPYIDVRVSGPFYNMKIYESSSSVTSFQYNFELAFKYFVTENFSINLYGGVISSKPYFSTTVESTINGSKTVENERFSQQILLINTGIGFTYVLQ